MPFDQIYTCLLDQHGFDISMYDCAFTERTILSRVAEVGSLTIDEYAAQIDNDPNEISELVRSFGVHHSQFFRNPFTFAVLENQIIPMLKNRMKTGHLRSIRIWSAACAAGQEAYSLAMILEDQILPYHIFGSDSNESMIAKAKLGLYGHSDIQNLPFKFVTLWFKQKGDVFTLDPDLVAKVEFSTFDLLNDSLRQPSESIFGSFDIVFCANMLYYYNTTIQSTLITKVVDSLAPNGFLVTSETERELLISLGYREYANDSAIFQT